MAQHFGYQELGSGFMIHLRRSLSINIIEYVAALLSMVITNNSIEEITLSMQ
jgi:hypothetical protein